MVFGLSPVLAVRKTSESSEEEKYEIWMAGTFLFPVLNPCGNT